MSEQQPPIPFPLNPIFNLNDWIYDNTALTIGTANQLYLRKAGDTATGAITFNGGLFCNSSAVFTLFIEFANATQQTTAYKSLPQGTYSNANIVVNVDGQIDSISSGSSSITTNSLVITPNTIPQNPSAGITNAYNTGGYTSRFGNDANNYATLTIDFNDSGGLAIDDALLFEFQCSFWDNQQPADEWGQTTGQIMVFPARFFNNMGANDSYNINNKIDDTGQNTFNYTDATYAPYGRPYWTFNTTFTFINNANAYLVGGLTYITIKFPNPYGAPNVWNRNVWCRCLDASVLLLRGVTYGVQLTTT